MTPDERLAALTNLRHGNNLETVRRDAYPHLTPQENRQMQAIVSRLRARYTAPRTQEAKDA